MVLVVWARSNCQFSALDMLELGRSVPLRHWADLPKLLSLNMTGQELKDMMNPEMEALIVQVLHKLKERVLYRLLELWGSVIHSCGMEQQYGEMETSVRKSVVKIALMIIRTIEGAEHESIVVTVTDPEPVRATDVEVPHEVSEAYKKFLKTETNMYVLLAGVAEAFTPLLTCLMRFWEVGEEWDEVWNVILGELRSIVSAKERLSESEPCQPRARKRTRSVSGSGSDDPSGRRKRRKS